MGNDLNKKLQDLFERPPDIPFDEKAWQRMQKKLYKSNFSKKYGMLIWLPFLITSLIGLFTLGYYFGTQNIPQSTPLSIPSPKEGTPPTEKHTSIAPIPTKIKTVIVYDTITTYIVKHTTVKEIETSIKGLNYPTLLTLNASSGGSIYDQYLSKTLAFDYPKTRLFSSSYPLVSLKIEDNRQENEIDEPSSSLVKSIVSEMPLQIQSNKEQATIDLPSVELLESKRPLAYYLDLIKPKNIGITASKGDFNNLNAQTTIGKQTNTSYSLRIQFYYNRRFSALIGAEFIENLFDFYTDQPGSEEMPSGFPIVPPTVASDVLHEIKGNFSYYQIPLGVHYNFPQKGVFEPFIGAGLYFQKSKTSTLIYDYLSNGTEYEIKRNNLLPSTFKLNSYWAEAGLRVYLSSHWALEGAFEGQFHLEDGFYKYEKQELLKWRAGLSYYF